MALTRNIYPKGILNVGKKLIDFSNDDLYLIFTNDYVYNAAHEAYADVSADEIAQQNAYITGGGALTSVTWATGDGFVRLDADDYSITANDDGNFPDFNGYIIYTQPSNLLLLYVDLGQTYEPEDDEQIIVPFGANGIFKWVVT